jgi:hypothetical protein
LARHVETVQRSNFLDTSPHQIGKVALLSDAVAFAAKTIPMTDRQNWAIESPVTDRIK